MKNLWIINQYIGTPHLGIDGHRHYYFAKKFKEKGINVSLLTASFSHVPLKDFQSPNTYDVIEEEYGKLGIIQTPKYKNARGIGRIWSMVVFTLKLFFFPFKKLPRPDVVIVSSISLLPILNGLLLRRKYGCKLILEIRDIWPLSIVELGSFSKYNPFVLFLAFIEKIGYKKYDYITSLFPGTVDHIEEVIGRPITNFAHIPNGIFLEEKNLSEPLKKEAKDLIPVDKFVIGYAGSLGVANAMECIISAINQIDNDEICLCIVGHGYLKDDLIRIAGSNPNIIFIDPIPKRQIESLLSNFDVLFISWQNSPLYRFGVSANKIYDYMYAAKPLLMSGNIGYNIVDKANCGLTTPPLDVDEIKSSILSLKNKNQAELDEMGKRGKGFVLEHNTIDRLSDKYIEIFNTLVLINH